MYFKRLYALFKARNKEFFRDKASFGWNFLFPFLIIAGFAVIFGGQEQKRDQSRRFPLRCFPFLSGQYLRSPITVHGALRHFHTVRFDERRDGQA